MAIATQTDWEVRTTGANTNGAGFKDLNPGTSVDYSQQASAQLALTDITTNGAGTGVGSVTGGFTAAMEGNCIYLSGAGVTTGWYQITAYTDGNNVTIDRSAGASASGITGNVGGAYTLASATDNTFFNATNKGIHNYVWIAAGTYTVTWVITVARSYSHWRGYNSARGDDPTDTDRPYFDFGAGGSHYYINFNTASDYSSIKNLRFSSRDAVSSTSTVIILGNATIVVNCLAVRDGYNTEAWSIAGAYSSVIQCHAESDIGSGFNSQGQGIVYQFCYADVAVSGFYYSSASATENFYDSCIAANCTNGFQGYTGTKWANCTVYGCTTGILLGSYGMVWNSIISTCTTGVSGTAFAHASNNCMYNNTADYSGGIIDYGDGDISSDPLMTNPASGDFSLAAGSPCYNTGLKLGATVGL